MLFRSSKKKKSKKGAKAKDQPTTGNGKATDGHDDDRDRPPGLFISRNKHWRYISSYHVRSTSYFLSRSRDSTHVLTAACRARGSSFPWSSSSRFSCSISTPRHSQLQTQSSPLSRPTLSAQHRPIPLRNSATVASQALATTLHPTLRVIRSQHYPLRHHSPHRSQGRLRPHLLTPGCSVR